LAAAPRSGLKHITLLLTANAAGDALDRLYITSGDSAVGGSGQGASLEEATGMNVVWKMMGPGSCGFLSCVFSNYILKSIY